MSSWRAGSAFPHLPACGGCVRWNRRDSSPAIAEADLKAFEAFVRRAPLVSECWMLSGEIDFILKCVAPDLKTFQAFVAELTAAPNVRNVKTSLTLRNSKDAAMVPFELPLPGRR
jgi:DNA-binding Lrp family transcriptional regulator